MKIHILTAFQRLRGAEKGRKREGGGRGDLPENVSGQHSHKWKPNKQSRNWGKHDITSHTAE